MKSMLFVVGLAFLTASAPGQGTLVFKNDERMPVRRIISFPNTATLDWGFVQLAYSAPGARYTVPQIGAGYPIDVWLRLNPGWRLGPTAMVEHGLFQGGEVPLEGFRPGDTVQYLVLGWAYTDTWDQAVYNDDAFFGPTDGPGSAGPRQVVVGGGDVAAPLLADTFPGLILWSSRVIPEPGTLTLAGLGLLAWACRRQCCAK